MVSRLARVFAGEADEISADQMHSDRRKGAVNQVGGRRVEPASRSRLVA